MIPGAPSGCCDVHCQPSVVDRTEDGRIGDGIAAFIDVSSFYDTPAFRSFRRAVLLIPFGSVRRVHNNVSGSSPRFSTRCWFSL